MADPDQMPQPSPGQQGCGDDRQDLRQTEPEPADQAPEKTPEAPPITAPQLTAQTRQPQEQGPQQQQKQQGQQQAAFLEVEPSGRQSQPPCGSGAAEGRGPPAMEGQAEEGGELSQQRPEAEQQQHEEERKLQEADPAGTDAEELARAEALKREGNELFGNGMWIEAAAKYNEALEAAPGSATKEQAVYFANLAACNIKINEYAYAVQNCTEAIRLNGSYLKAYMRRCEAFERLDELDHALGDAKSLLQMEPENAWAKAKVATLQPKVEERTEKLKTEMFSKLKDLGNTVLGKFGLSLDNFKFDKDPNSGGYSVRFER